MTDWTEDDDALVISCIGPPLCLLKDAAAIAAGEAGCDLCKRIVIHADGTETVVERSVQ